MNGYDIAVIGGGIVGVTTAWKLKQYYSDASILLMEKESSLSYHQTGHNSGVIHAGVYYTPGSLKAEFCKRGAAQTIAFCKEHHLPFEQCGKLLVATDSVEYDRMNALESRCIQNGIETERLSEAELKKREPNIEYTCFQGHSSGRIQRYHRLQNDYCENGRAVYFFGRYYKV